MFKKICKYTIYNIGVALLTYSGIWFIFFMNELGQAL